MNFFHILIALALGGYGVFCIRCPEDAIYLQHFWHFRDYEPTEGYIRWTRVGGGFCIAAAVIVFIFAFSY